MKNEILEWCQKQLKKSEDDQKTFFDDSKLPPKEIMFQGGVHCGKILAFIEMETFIKSLKEEK